MRTRAAEGTEAEAMEAASSRQHNSGVGPGIEWDVVHLRYEDGGDRR